MSEHLTYIEWNGCLMSEFVLTDSGWTEIKVLIIDQQGVGPALQILPAAGLLGTPE